MVVMRVESFSQHIIAGIPEEQLNHICELFHTSKLTHDSMGIGMFGECMPWCIVTSGLA